MAEGLRLAVFERPIVHADVCDQAKRADVEGRGVARVFGVVEFGDAVGFSIDRAGVIAPDGGFFAGLFFPDRAGGRSDLRLATFDALGNGRRDPRRKPASLYAI